MKLPRFQFGLRFFLIAVVISAFAVIFLWERANRVPVIRSGCNVLGVVTYGNVAELEDLSLSRAEAMRSINLDRRNNVELQKHVPPDVFWQSVDIEPLESVIDDELRWFPLIGYGSIRKRDFRCTLAGVDAKGSEVKAIVIVNRNHPHITEIN